jgi:hypothetical protein
MDPACVGPAQARILVRARNVRQHGDRPFARGDRAHRHPRRTVPDHPHDCVRPTPPAARRLLAKASDASDHIGDAENGLQAWSFGRIGSISDLLKDHGHVVQPIPHDARRGLV